MGFIFDWWGMLKAIGCDKCIEDMRRHKEEYERRLKALTKPKPESKP